MRKNLCFIILLLAAVKGFAQPYNNEWIDYAKTYYKFKVPATGLQRITQASLLGAGLGSVPAQNFQLFRNGQQVPLYTTVATGTLSAADYIEFWGEMNDGKPDNALYENPAHQMSSKWSLATDTAVYFLTSNDNIAQNLRYTVTANNVAGNSLPVEPWFMYTTGTHFKNMINPGFAAVVGENLHASVYDKGEGWSSSEIYPGGPLSETFSNLFVETTGPAATYSIGGSGNALNARTILTTINGNQVMNQVMDYFDYYKGSASFPVSHLSSGSAAVSVTNTSGNGNDRMVLSFHEITYPRKFNFGGQSKFEFTLPANPAGNYLEIANFNDGGSAPVLYDVTNKRRYVAVTGGGFHKFALLPSAAARNLVLVSQNTGIASVTAFTQRNFTNFMALASQGDYLIISSKILHNAADPNNGVEKYKTYRASLAGGGFNVKVVDAEDLAEQYSFGIKQHPSSVRNYLRRARNTFVAAPKFVLIIGRGTSYNEARMNEGQPYQDLLNMVPTFGYPASDNMLTAEPGTSIQTTPIGRLGAVYPSEVESYLAKLKEYELAQANNVFTIDNKAWMMNHTFVAGSSEPFLQPIIDGYMQQYMESVKDTLIGGKDYLFTKTQAGGVVPLSNTFMESLWAKGHSLLTYFGHSSASTLEYNLDDPYAYNNPGKYPMMMINGCNSGNYFIYNPFRITTNNNSTLSEKFLFANQRGSIGFIASTHFGVVNYLHYYTQSFYKAITTYDYGQPIGKIMKDAAQGMYNITGPNDFYSKMHAEEICLHGDPAVKLNASYPKPDYVIEDQTVKITPNFISVAENNFKVDLSYMNLGMAKKDSLVIEIKRQYPAGNTVVALRKKVAAAYYLDSLSAVFTINPLTDKGLNRLIIKVEADNLISEMSEINNTVTKEFFIYEDEARPVFPYNYAIVSQLPQKLYASTANPLSLPITYNMEMDTTELFNSAAKITRTVTQSGGILEFDPGTLVNNTTYYWRVAPQPTGTAQPNWNKASFVYINGSSAGFNQGHLYQHFKSTFDKIILDSVSRKFNFDSIFQNLYIRSGVFPSSAWEEAQLTISVNQDPYIRSFCGGDRVAVNVFDPVSGEAWLNPTVAGVGQFSSLASDCGPGRGYNFEYDYTSRTDRNKAMNMLTNNIPTGYFVVIRNISLQWTDTATLVNSWKTDAALNGTGNSLYNTLKAAGFSNLDSFYKVRAWSFIYRKGVPSFTPRIAMSENEWDRINTGSDIKLPDTLGYITSPAFGPARSWQEVHWRGSSIDAGGGDVPSVQVIGVAPNGSETPLYNLSATQQDFDISSVSATQYPYLKLKMRNQDSVYATPYQLQYWRINFTPIPEGAVAPNITVQVKDTSEAGEPLQVKLAFKNISNTAFTDSLKVKMIVTDKNNAPITFTLPRQKKLAPGEVLTIDYTIPTANLVGNNQLFVDVNPDNDQPEQFHFNNFIYKNFFVKPDGYNPLLDVTFDGTHILNKDIVSSQPHITIKLKDESRFLALDDTSLVSVQVRYPNAQQGVLATWRWNTDTLRFTPANLANGENTATIDFTPTFREDGTYELIVKGKDKSGNTAGDIEYKVLFQVYTKPMISNLLNYPNPFTTSTAFVFTVTGKEVPQNIKIQILTITGKIVREITKAELGPLRVGRNITDFKWDGTDQYGQKLANGVYLYHVVTNLNGKALDHFKVGKDDKTDQYFNKGYGKMVLIR
jgi:hypothetical protein